MKLHNWNYLNGLKWNFDKCDIMIYDKWKTKNNTYIKYKIGKHEIKHTSVIKDLGIYFEDNLKFDVHIENMISKSKRRIYFLKKILQRFNNIDSLKLFYNSHIKSILMYGSILN